MATDVTTKSLLSSLDELTDTQAAEKKLMVSSCAFALVAILLSAFSLLASGPRIVAAADFGGAVVLLLQLIWIWRKDRFLVQWLWLLTLMAGIILVAVVFNGIMSAYWLYPMIVYCYFWLDVKKATLFSLVYTLLICAAVIWVEGFSLLLELRILGAALMSTGLLYYFALVRDNYIQKLAQGNSAYRNYTEILSGKVELQFEQIKQSEEKFRGIADAARDAVVVLDDEGKLTYWNPAAEHIFGYHSEEVLGRDLPQVLVPERYRSDFVKGFAGFRLTGSSPFVGKTTELMAVRKDGSELPVSLSASAFKLNQRWNAVGILRDMTERQLAEVVRTQLAAIVESTEVAIIGEDLNGRITSWNLGAEKVYGYTAAEMIGQHGSVLAPAERKREIQDLIDKIKRGEPVQRFETTRLKKNNGLIDVSLALSPIRSERGDLVGVSAVVHDVTETKKSERALKALNRALKTRSSWDLVLVHAADETRLMEETCRVLVEVGGYRFAWVGFAQHDEGKTVRPVASYGDGKGFLEGAQLSWADTEQGRSPWGTAIRTGSPQIDHYAASRPVAMTGPAQQLKHGYRSIMALALQHNAEKLGVLVIYASDPEAFPPEEVKLITELGADLSYGITALRTHVAHEKGMERLQKSMESTISAVARMVELRDPYTTGHQQRVAELAVAIGRAMGLPEQTVYGLHLAGIVHDLGKIRIPAEILSNPGKLTKIENEMIRTHPEAGYDILKNVDFLWPIAQTVLQHHERIDGSGYPAGLKGDQILLEAKIVGVADVVEAIASHRPYRASLGLDAALKELTDHRGQLYDPEVVDTCVRLFREKTFSFEAHDGD